MKDNEANESFNKINRRYIYNNKDYIIIEEIKTYSIFFNFI